MSAVDEFSEDERLAVYGSLKPGGSNEHILSELSGLWLTGDVRGELVEQGWAALQGYPGIRLSEAAAAVAVEVFCSHELPGQWETLDRFEGPQYRRVVTAVTTDKGPIAAYIYELANP
jgi:gamma-glutamylcyclotransferase (GGCT)/AIG2-like uncharacterized protein YtfP